MTFHYYYDKLSVKMKGKMKKTIEEFLKLPCAIHSEEDLEGGEI